MVSAIKPHMPRRKKEPDELAKEEYLKKRGIDFKTNQELLNKHAVGNLIKDHIEVLLRQIDYTEEELKTAVWKWLGY